MVICRAIKKYGPENFIVEQIDQANSMEELGKKESYHAKHLNTYTPDGYNVEICGTAKGSSRVREETRLKNSKTHIFISPSNERVEIVNLFRFSKENGLNPTCMSRVSTGHLNGHRGWKGIHRKHVIYHFKSVVTGEEKSFDGGWGFISIAAAYFGSTLSAVSLLVSGKYKTSKGWKLNQVEHIN